MPEKISKRQIAAIVIISAVILVVYNNAVVFPVKHLWPYAKVSEDKVHAINRTRRSLELQDFDEDGIDLRINTKDCRSPGCVKCTIDVTPNFKPIDCTGNENIINGSCFLCNGICKRFKHLLSLPGTILCHRPIDCCLMSEMRNWHNYCGRGDNSHCYNDKVHKRYKQSIDEFEPICACSDDNKSRHCKKNPYTRTVRCTCYRSERKLCGKRAPCDSVGEKWKSCHQTITTRSGELYTCLCKKRKQVHTRLIQCVDIRSQGIIV